MLLKNDEIWPLPASEIEKVYTALGWKKGKRNRPVVFKMPEENYVWDPANNRKVRPSAINIPLQDKEDNEEEGTIKWNYCERPPSKNRETGGFIYDRKSYPMSGDFTLTQDKIELIWFLMFKSSVRRPNYNADGTLKAGEKYPKSRPCFYIQNKSDEAIAKLAKRELRINVESLIIGSNQWPEAKIRKYATAFGCDVSEEDTIEEVKSILLGAIEGKAKGYQEFMELTGGDRDVDLLFLINKAVKGGNIKFVPTKNAWFYLNEGGKLGAQIVNGSSKMTHDQALLQYMKDNPDIEQSIAAFIR